jgi:hypothetical protein
VRTVTYYQATKNEMEQLGTASEDTAWYSNLSVFFATVLVSILVGLALADVWNAKTQVLLAVGVPLCAILGGASHWKMRQVRNRRPTLLSQIEATTQTLSDEDENEAANPG